MVRSETQCDIRRTTIMKVNNRKLNVPMVMGMVHDFMCRFDASSPGLTLAKKEWMKRI